MSGRGPFNSPLSPYRVHWHETQSTTGSAICEYHHSCFSLTVHTSSLQLYLPSSPATWFQDPARGTKVLFISNGKHSVPICKMGGVLWMIEWLMGTSSYVNVCVCSAEPDLGELELLENRWVTSSSSLDCSECIFYLLGHYCPDTLSVLVFYSDDRLHTRLSAGGTCDLSVMWQAAAASWMKDGPHCGHC